MDNQIKTRIVLRNGTSEEWESSNPTLLKGEIGLESNTNRFKIGNGTTAWNDLEYTGINESIKTPEDLIPATMIEQDEDHMFITQIEREDWNNKANKTLDNVELDRAFWKNSFADAWGYYCLPNGLRFQWNTATFFNGAATRNVYLSYSVNAPICVMASIIKTDETVNLDVRVKFVNSSTLNISVKRNDGMGLSGNTTITYFVIETIQEYK